MTPRTFANVLKGHQITHREKLSMHREQVMMGLMPHLDKASRKKSIQELMPLPWEKAAKSGGKDAQAGRLNKVESLAVWDKADGKKDKADL